METILEANGRVRLLEPVELGTARRALVTILEESPEDAVKLSALLSEVALADWSRPEEDDAWSHLQPAP